MPACHGAANPLNFFATGPAPVKNRDAGVKTVFVYCASANGRHHNKRLRLADFPAWDWYDISTHPRCTACVSVGFVGTRVDWSGVINFNECVNGQYQSPLSTQKR